MNFQNLNFDYVEHARNPDPRFISRAPRTATEEQQQQQQQQQQDYASNRPASPSAQPTAVPYAPTPPSPSASGATPDLYGPDRLYGPPLVLPGDAFTRPRTRPQLTLDEIQHVALHTAVAGQMAQSYKDELAREAGRVTPGVDDTPYIHYALEVLTRDRDTGYSQNADSSSSGASDPYRRRIIPDQGLGYYTPQAAAAAAAAFPSRAAQAANLHHHPRAQPPAPGGPSAQPGSGLGAAPLSDPFPRRTAERPWREQRSIGTTAGVPGVSGAPQPQAGSRHSSLDTLVPHTRLLQPPRFAKDAWRPMDYDRISPQEQRAFPRPDFKPKILRPFSLGLLMVLCILMIAGLIFSAVWSQARVGLWDYGGTIYGGQYFVFRILPQLLAAVVYLYAQAVIAAVVRILPFSRMEAVTNPRPEERYGALFEDLYPRSFLWPQLVGPWQTRVPCVVVWLMNFTIPLQSSLFTVILVNGNWRWAAVQGIAWTLVGLYIGLLASTAILLFYWQDRRTGLIWDPRSIADIAALVTNSNTLADYRGTELLGTRGELRAALSRRAADKLGYWTWRDNRNQGMWHGIATDMGDEAWLDEHAPAGKRSRRSRGEKQKEKQELGGGSGSGGLEALADVEANSPHSPQVRYRYLPWCLRDGPMIFFALAAMILLIALFIVSFLPSTDIRRGFLPLLSAGPVGGAFSAADFLYSFLPSLIGQILFLLFQSLDISLRVLQPWAELARGDELGGGAPPERSVLADYAACLPLQSAWHAARNGHWRVAAISLLATLFVLIPALAGGLFMALTISSTGEVRMLPNVPLYAVVLALLVLYFLALVALLPGRRWMRLPHAVTCVAEIVSFCGGGGSGAVHEEEDVDDSLMADDEAFKDVLSKTALRGKMGVDRAPAFQPRWAFGVGAGRASERLGIRRVRRYTELARRRSRRDRVQPQEQAQMPLQGQGQGMEQVSVPMSMAMAMPAQSTPSYMGQGQQQQQQQQQEGRPYGRPQMMI